MDPLLTTLERRFGFASFRLGQEALCRTIVAGHSVLGVMPTGAGKSLCFQLPALLREGPTLVISPLVALMRDQVESLRARDIPATWLAADQSPTERERRLAAVARGQFKFLYVAPERLRAAFVARVRAFGVSLLVVDEAHCISQWGHDFRPEYLTLGRVAAALGGVQVAAFTATATEEVRRDIIDTLQIPPADVYVTGFHRPNLRFDVVGGQSTAQAKFQTIQRYLRLHPDQAGIVYAATRKQVEQITMGLAQSGLSVGRYHAGLDIQERRQTQGRFMRGATRVMVATNAFGMGVDRADLRFVIHWALPGSVEALYQEAGRAGRDGRPALCALLFDPADIQTQRFLIDRREAPQDSTPTERAEQRRRRLARLEALIRYAQTPRCRHEALLDYFGQGVDPGGCGACDVCLGGPVMAGLEVSGRPIARRRPPLPRPQSPPRALSPAERLVVQKLLSALARADARCPAAVVIAALVGSSAPRVVEAGLVGTRSHGLLRGWSRALLGQLVAALVDTGCLAHTAAGRAHYRLTTLGREVMWARANVQLAMPRFDQPGAATGLARPMLRPTDERLLAALQTIRDRAARRLGLPTIALCSEESLNRLATRRPRSMAAVVELAQLSELAERACAEPFLGAIAADADR